jgi:GTP diphosphokinase / guanosine-3',5'-bis(diphosphate) 3'-diphosphatase
MTIKTAKALAKKLYQGKERLSGEDFYSYALDIVKRLKQYGIKDEPTLITALLHGVTDPKTKKIPQEIADQLGEEIPMLLEKYERLRETKVTTESLKDFNEKYLNQTLINLVEDVRLLIIRVVVKLKDLEENQGLDKEKREEAAIRALYLYAPLAKILGVTNISKDLEDNAFKMLYPQEYFELEEIVRKRSWGTKKIFVEVEKVLTELLEEQGLSNFEIQYRTKALYSLFKKVLRYRKQGLDMGDRLEKIYDLFALRIIVPTVEECYLVETFLKQLWDYLPEERDDYIKNPRPTGYRAIHNVFVVEKNMTLEVQIRTHEMHNQAEYGISSHLLYKIGDKGEKSHAVSEYKKYLKTHPEWFRDINFWEIQKSEGFVSNTPFKDKVYVFTPKGDIIQLPRGATVVDFAFAVHTEIGVQCAGAFVNEKIVKLNHVVKTGDIVKIKTNKRRRKPSKDWLEFVKTNRAKIQINKAWD